MNQTNLPSVAQSKARIARHKEWLLRTTKQFMTDCPAVYYGDFVYAAIIDRTLSNIHGFLLLMQEKNFLCAASVLRQQIDTAMRANAFSLVSDPNELSQKIFNGVRFSQIKDDEGKLMKDHYLREKLSIRYPWVNQVYQETSGAVHLSERHIFSALTDVQKTGEMAFEISGLSNRPLEDFTELFAAFEHSIRMTCEVLFPEKS